ncbi:MAG: hypothetical protein IJO57_05570 [Bacilli bacterium]|nr:hypothetical protein [Bacilli bacterium]
MENNYKGEQFLDRLFKDLYKSKEVLNGNRNPSQKEANIRRYMERLEELHKRANESPREHDEYLLKKLYHDKYVIKEEEIPDSYYIHQQEIAFERGFGKIAITNELKKELANQVIEEQKKSLDYWLDYLTGSDSNMYPMWVKYWAFQGMLKLGSYDKEKRDFSRRTQGTVAPFIELNQEALSLSIDTLMKYLNKDEIDDKNLEKLLESGVFGKIYSYELTYLDKNKKQESNSNNGVWIKYPKGSDHMKLVKSIQGKGTGWCTAGEETAKIQLKNGDFHVYYSFDDNNQPTIPRLAIRMENGKIAEIRGISKNQNIETNMESIIEKKLEEFPDKDEYKQKVEDMRILTQIYKIFRTRELTASELRFLYEIDKEIIGFGYKKDPRIDEIISSRNKRKDYATIFSCKEDEIAFNEEELETNNNIICFIGDLDLSLYSVLPFKLPKEIHGNLYLDSLTSAEGLKLPEKITGDLNLRRLRSAEGLVFPKEIHGDLYLSGLTSAEGLKLPEKMNGELYLNGLTSAEGLILPKEIHGSLDLGGLTSTTGLVLPKEIHGDLYLDSLTSAEGLKLPEKMNGALNLKGLTSAKGLVLPKEIHGYLNLRGLTSTEGLELPKVIHGFLDLDSLTSIEGLILPQNFECRGTIYINNKKIWLEDLYNDKNIIFEDSNPRRNSI